MPVEIRETPIGGNLKQFLDVVDYIYRGDDNYIRPLDLDLKQRLSRKNPFFNHAEGVILTAHRNGWCVGRCTAQIDREHLARYKDDVGFFGFFDTVDDAEVSTALIDAASEWLRQRGMKRIRGPLSLNINDEMGCLVEGSDSPPVVMLPHHREYQGGLIEQAGLQKVKDAFSWRYTVGDVPKRARKAYDAVHAMPEVRTRNADKRSLESDIRIIMDVFNDAWSDNWGFVPLTEAELSKMAKELKLIVEPALSFITEIDGYPAAVAVALPNLNEAIRDLGGSLWPLGLGKLLWRLKVERPRSARVIILGIRKKFRGVKKYAGLSTYLYTQLNDSGQKLGYEWGELGWTLEDNTPVNLAIKFMGGKIVKRFRIYEAAL